jgi:diaminobutyrate-2-oxoglutarate transaminase
VAKIASPRSLASAVVYRSSTTSKPAAGRTGTFFSFEGIGWAPDIVVLSKSISGYELPMALLLIRPEYDVWKPGEHNRTFRGNAHAFVTGRTALEKFWDGSEFERKIAAKSALVGQRLLQIAALVPGGRCKGRGTMQGVDVDSETLAAEIRHGASTRGSLSRRAGGTMRS